MNLYETIYILKPDMEEEAIKAAVERFKNIIEENGEMDTIDEWGKRKLAYPIQYYKEGYYVYMKYRLIAVCLRNWIECSALQKTLLDISS